MMPVLDYEPDAFSAEVDRNIRPVGQAYKQLIQDWSGVLPAQSYCLVLPLDIAWDTDPDAKSVQLLRHAARTLQSDLPSKPDRSR